MDLLITLIVYIVLFAIVAYGCHRIITAYQLPQPVLWVVGASLLIALLIFIAKVIHGGFPLLHLT